MIWKKTNEDFQHYLRLRRGLSENTAVSYGLDIERLIQYLEEHSVTETPNSIGEDTLRQFVYEVRKRLNARSQAQLILSSKGFFKYMMYERNREDLPMEVIENPEIGMELPDTLSLQEIDAMLASIDLSTKEGHRSRATIETLYAYGLRVSELVSLHLSDLFFEENFVRVMGKGSKQRLIPVEHCTQKQISHYIDSQRKSLKIVRGSEDYVFSNRRGRQLARAVIFTIVRQMAGDIGLKKKISPHTFRHSFAAHLLENGVNLGAIQMMLGHENITTTEICVHVEKSYLREVLEKFHPRQKMSPTQ